MHRFGLSKSRIMAGLQCRKRLWLQVHRPELVQYSAAQQRAFRGGDLIGEIARAMFPGGILIGDTGAAGLRAGELRQAEAETRRRLRGSSDVTLFEATFTHQGTLVRADVLERHAGVSRMIEVKSSTRVKEPHILDAAIQTLILRGSGVPLERVALMIVDRDFVYAGDGLYDGLLTTTDVTQQVEALLPSLPARVEALRQMLAGPEPQILVGPACADPYDCPLLEYCCSGVAYHVALLPHGLPLAETLQWEGFLDVREIPEGRLTHPEHVRIWRSCKEGAPETDAELASFLRALPYPRYYLDFETVSPAVPIWPGTRPYDAVPYQFSVHVEHEDGRLEHREFLDLSGADPRRACARALLGALDTQGPVLTYTSYETSRLRDLCRVCADERAGLERIVERVVDLYPVVRAYYYHPDMRGSWSLKAVLPTVAPDLHYGDLLGVHDGSEAEEAFLEAIGPVTGEARRAQLREQLLRYCERDTLAMTRLVRHFQGTRASAEL